MMSFTSEEVYFYEGSLEEPVDLYDHESQIRFRRNVVYVPHVLTPVLLLEYVPVYVNYQTYDPYLINRFEVAYVPFLRPVSYIQFVPYYSLQATEIISSSAPYEEDIFSNSDSSLDSSDTFEAETSELSFLSEDNDSQLTESSSDVILESSFYRESSAEQAPFDDLEFKDEDNLTANDFDEISTFSWSNSESSNQMLEFPFSPETSKTSGTQGFIYSEINDEVFSKYDKEHVIDCKCPKEISSAEVAGRAKEANFSNSSCFDVIEEIDFVDPINENQASPHDSGGTKEDDRSYNYDEHTDWKCPEVISSAEDAGRAKEANFSNSFCFDVIEEIDFVEPIYENQASPHDSDGTKEDDRSYNDDEHTDWKCPKVISSAEDAGRAKEANFSNSFCFDVIEEIDFVDPINENQASPHDSGGTKEDDRSYNDDEHTDWKCPEVISSAEDAGRAKEANFSNSFCFDVIEEIDFVDPINENQASPHDSGGTKEDDRSYNDDEHTDWKCPEVISSAEDAGRAKEANFSNSFCFNVIEEIDFVDPINENQASPHDSGGTKEDDRSYNDDEHTDWKCPEVISSAEDAGRAKEANFSNSFCFDVIEEIDFVDPINENQASPHDSGGTKEDDRSYNDDEDDDPPITLEDVLPSDEYWRVKREEYCIRRNNQELYRSALEGDIRPRRSLPNVGTLDTIFEDLPFPVNQPYDDGRESNEDEYFDLALAPLEADRSESSTTALIPKKKRFKNTRKLFSRLFWCCKPKTVKAAKPP